MPSANRPSSTGRSSASGRISRGGTPPAEGGFPLPLAASWNVEKNVNGGWGADYMQTLHAAGHHVLLTFMWPDSNESGNAGGTAYYDLGIPYCAANNLPVCFMSTQWEWRLQGSGQDTTYAGRTWASGTNPNAFDLSHNIALEEPGNLGTCALDPLGPVAPWQDEGALWTAGTEWSYVQSQYPAPPKVVLLSNNETPTQRWSYTGVLAPENTARYFEAHGSGQTDLFKRTVFGQGYATRYNAFFAAMRAALATQPWRDTSLMAGYIVAGSWLAAGGWNGWEIQWEGSDPENFFDWGPLAWQGGSPPYYVSPVVDQSDYWPWCPQFKAQNLVHVRDWIRQNYPDYWYEISYWDGALSVVADDRRAFYASQGQTWSPDRYVGTAQYGMWLLRPCCIRDFRITVDTRSTLDFDACFLELVDACDRVWNNAILEQFWKFGTNVPNTAAGSPWTFNIPAGYESYPRWFMLTTSLDPARPWPTTSTVSIPVFSLAHVIGTTPSREWLLYAHSPLQVRTGVTITVPGFGDVTNLTIPVAGGFWHIKESDSSVTLLNV